MVIGLGLARVYYYGMDAIHEPVKLFSDFNEQRGRKKNSTSLNFIRRKTKVP